MTDRIEAAHRQVDEIHQSIRDIEGYIEQQVEAFRSGLFDRYKDELGRYCQELSKAYEERDTAIEADQYEESAKMKDHPMVGQMLHEWSKGRWGCGRFRSTGKVGVVEPWTPEMNGMRKVGSMIGRPGDLVIRHLKKDGTVGRVYEVASLRDEETGIYGWYPDGVDPNKERK
jgi:hypothetical protein